MAEIEPCLRAAVGAASPLGTMVGIDIQDAVLLVVEVVGKIEQGVGMPDAAPHKTVVGLRCRETSGLTEQRVDIEIGRHRCHIVRIMHLCGRESGLHCLRFGGNFPRLLYHRLKIPLYGHIAVERCILGVGTAGNRRSTHQ